MARKKLTVEDYVNAILDRDGGVPYPDVLATYRISPNQFFVAVRDKLSDFIKAASGQDRQILEAIASGAVRERELFNMGEAFIIGQYGLVRAGAQAYLPKGTLRHPENIKTLVYHALASNNPRMASAGRKEVIEAVKSLPTDLQKYLNRIGLSGLIANRCGKKRQYSLLDILKIFDMAYMAKTGDASLFDLKQPEHLHRWGDNFHAPRMYWKNPSNFEEAVYHMLAENHPMMASAGRKEVIEAVKSLPTDLQIYFKKIGLGGLMAHSFMKGMRNSPLAILEVFDRAYTRRTGDASLFDLEQPEHLHKWGDNFKAPSRYWRDPANTEEAVHHMLAENHPMMASAYRKEVIEAVKSLPTDLHRHLFRMGLSGLMDNAFKKSVSSPRAVLEAFDRAYQRKTGNPSLFDRAQGHYLEFSGQNRLVR